MNAERMANVIDGLISHIRNDPAAWTYESRLCSNVVSGWTERDYRNANGIKITQYPSGLLFWLVEVNNVKVGLINSYKINRAVKHIRKLHKAKQRSKDLACLEEACGR